MTNQRNHLLVRGFKIDNEHPILESSENFVVMSVERQIGQADNPARKGNYAGFLCSFVFHMASFRAVVGVAQSCEKQLQRNWLIKNCRNVVQHDDPVTVFLNQVEESNGCHVAAMHGV